MTAAPVRVEFDLTAAPAMLALERMREAWEKAGRPGPGSRQLVIDLPALPIPDDREERGL